jgi:hypothetical protein
LVGKAREVSFARAFAAIVCCLVLLAISPWSNAQTAPKAQREIEALIAALGGSGCEFERNGRWYDAKTAQAHLRKKHAYLNKRDLAETAELFIERGASRSSVSGKAYRVRCGGPQAESSAAWFRRKLGEIRAGRGV